MKIVIFGVGDTDGEHQECQSVEFAERETRDCKSSGVGDAAEDLIVYSCHAVGAKVDIGGVELDFEAFDGFVEKDIAQVLMLKRGCAGMATAQSTSLPESANHFEVVLVFGLEGVVLGSSLGRQLVKCKVHPAVRRSPARDVCPVRLVGDGYTL